MKYAFVKAYQNEHTITLMCQVLELSPSAYYDWLKCPVSLHQQEDQRLAEKIKTAHEVSQGTYGAVTVHERESSNSWFCGKGNRTEAASSLIPCAQATRNNG